MKRQTILLLCATSVFTFGACISYSQSGTVLSVVQNSFNAQHPNAANVDWDRVGKDYEAEYGPHDKEVTVRIDRSGKILRQKTEMAATCRQPRNPACRRATQAG